jgi:hypothetical protein
MSVFADAANKAGAANGPFPSPADWRDQWIYFLMVDLFCNAQRAPNHLPFDDPNFDQYQGGSYAGVRSQLPYIKSLGAGAIWLTPVLKNLPFSAGSYHSYGIHDFVHAEPRFAQDPGKADDELRALVDAAHEQGLYVIFDIVLNHTGDVFAYQCSGGDLAYLGSQGAEASHYDSSQAVLWRDTNGVAAASATAIEDITVLNAGAYVWPAELQIDAFSAGKGYRDPRMTQWETLLRLSK